MAVSSEHNIRLNITAHLSSLAGRDGMLVRPPIWYSRLAGQLAMESGSGIGKGHIDDARGAALPSCTPKYQDTYLFGTAGRTGIAFDSISGSWSDKHYSPWAAGKSGLISTDGRDGVASQVRMHSAQTWDEHYHVVLCIGYATGATTHSKAEVYTYLDLNYEGESRYRLAFLNQSPIILQYWAVGASEWKDVATTKNIASLDAYLRTNRDRIDLWVQPDFRRRQMHIVIGDGHDKLLHKPDPETTLSGPNKFKLEAGALPSQLRIDLSAKNGWRSLEVFPLRYDGLSASQAGFSIGGNLSLNGAAAVLNLLSATDGERTTTLTPRTTGAQELGFDLTVSMPDAGDGLGSKIPAFLSDVTILIPSQWATQPLKSRGRIPTVQVQERQVWDDIERYGHTEGVLIANNYDGALSDLGNEYLALDLWASDGRHTDKRCTGIAGVEPGVELSYDGNARLARIPFYDNTYKFKQALCQECIVDGVASPAVIRLLAEIGSFRPNQYLRRIANPGLPPYPDTIFFTPILSKGTGSQANWHYQPTDQILDVMKEVTRDLGLVNPGLAPPRTATVTPYMLWQDKLGQLMYLPYNPRLGRPIASYSTRGVGRSLIQGLRVLKSPTNLRTEVIVQGEYALDHTIIDRRSQLPLNWARVGFRKPVVLRHPRYCTEEAVLIAEYNLKRASMLPSELLEITVPFDSRVRAGDVIEATDHLLLKKTDRYRIIDLFAVYGQEDVHQVSGRHISQMTLVCRSLSNEP